MAILGILEDRAMHGYEIRKALTAPGGSLRRLSFGSLYPSLSRLEGLGHVRVLPIVKSKRVSVGAQGVRRSSSEDKGRNKKVYEITASGKQAFSELLETQTFAEDDEREFFLRLFFADLLKPQALVRLLERRRQYANDLLADIEVGSSAGSKSHFRRSILELRRCELELEIAWLEQLIAAEDPKGASEESKIGSISR